MRHFSFLLVALLTLSSKVFCCTDFVVTADDGSFVNGRSMEYALDLNSEIFVHPRGESKQSMAPNKEKGLSWTSKYGYCCFNFLGLNSALDGLNEKGLSLSILWMPGTEYQEVPSEQSSKAIEALDLGEWVLGNFATAEEVKNAMSQVLVWAQTLAQIGGVPTFHLAVHDAQGKSIVIEFWNKEQKIYDNPIQVMTNYPTFDWHLVNLKNFVNLRALNAAPLKMDGMVLGQTGQGTGLLGIPGDWTPPSRFVRIALFKEFATKPKDAKGAVNLAAHLLNTVDIPYGDIEEKGKTNNIDYTQWVVIKDLTNKVLYFRTYQNLSLQRLDLTKVNLAPKAPVLKLALPKEPSYVEVTAQPYKN